jgi:hypothetical protein
MSRSLLSGYGAVMNECATDPALADVGRTLSAQVGDLLDGKAGTIRDAIHLRVAVAALVYEAKIRVARTLAHQHDAR